MGEYVKYTIFVTFIFSATDLRATPKPIFVQNCLNDVDQCKDMPFAVKITTFSNP